MRKSKHPDVCLTAGWSQALLKPLVGHVSSGKRDNNFTVFKFKIEGFVQKLNEDGYELRGLRYGETERKAYGRIGVEIGGSEFTVPVLVNFCVASDNNELPPGLGKDIDGRYVNPYYLGWLHFSEFEVDSSSRLPALQIVIWLRPEEWKSVRESFLIAGFTPIMSVAVDFSSNPDPSTSSVEILKGTFYVRHFWINGTRAYDSKALLENPLFKFDWDL